MIVQRTRQRVELVGTLAPGGSRGIARRGRRWIKGPVIVCPDPAGAREMVASARVHPGDILVVLAGDGPAAALAPLAEALRASGCAQDVALVTDGDAADDIAGIVVDQVRPSASAGGPIARIRTGEVVIIAIDEGRIDLLGVVTDAAASAPTRRSATAKPTALELHFGLPNGGGTSVKELERQSVAAEEGGASGIWLFDHVLPPRSFTPHQWNLLEPLITLAHLAGIVRRVRLGTSIVVLPMRNPFIVAKQVAALDVISEGRVDLGLGAGYSIAEFRNVHARFEDRGERLDEGIRLLRHLFSGSEAGFEGRHYSYDDGVFMPLPPQGAAMPFMVGGHTAAAVRRAATVADAWHPNGLEPDEYRGRLRDLDRERGARMVIPGARFSIGPDIEATADLMSAWADAGARHLVVNVPRAGAEDTIKRAAEAFGRVH